MRTLVRECRRLMPDVGIQIPPNLSDWWLPLVDEGATDLGGLSANGDHISPEHPFPSVHEMRKRLAPRGAGARRAPVRLPAVHEPRLARAGRARRDQGEVLVLHPAERLGPARGAARSGASSCRRPSSGRTAAARSARRSSRRCSPRRGPRRSRTCARRRTRCARELAGDTVTFVVNRNINVSNVCIVGCAFCGFGQGTALAGRLRARRGGVPAPGARGGRFRRHRDLHAVGHPPGLDDRGLRGLAADRQGRGAGHPPARVLADGAPLHGRRAAARRGVRAPEGGRPRLHAGHRRRGAPRRRAPAHLARTSCRWRAGSRSSRPPTPRACAAP